MKRELFGICILFIIVSLIFFYPVVKGFIPFPGDLLVGNHEPYKSYSFLGFSPSGVPHKAQGSDVARQLYPWKHFTIGSFKSLDIPLWNPYSLSGNPLIANFQSGSFYPLNLIFFIFNFIDAWTIFIILTPILACFFVYLFLRELGLKISSSIFSGIVFAFSSYMVVWMEYGNVGHTFLWLPLMLLMLEKFIKKQRLMYIICFIIVSSMGFLAGYVQGYFYIVLVGTTYFIGRSISLKKLSKRSIFLFTTGLILSLFLSAFQLFPTIELFKYSSRSGYSLDQIDKLLNPIWYVITAIIPNFFGHPAARNSWFYGTYIERVSYFGLIPFIFSIYALVNVRKRKEIIIFGGLFICSFLLATNLFFNKFIYLIPLPLLSTTVPTRILSVFVFCGSILSGFGLDFFLKKINKKSIVVMIFLILGINALLWLFIFLAPMIFSSSTWVSNFSIAKRNFILPTLFSASFLIVVYVHFKFNNSKNIVLIALFILTFFDLFYFFQKITPFAPAEFIYPNTPVISKLRSIQGIDRSWGYGSGFIEPNFQTYEKIFSAEGYDALFIKRYAEFISVSKDGGIAQNIPRSDVNIANGFGGEDLKTNFYRQRIIDLLGVKYILHKKDQAFPKDLYTLIWGDNVFQIYKNPHAVPRVFLTDQYFIEENKDKIIKRMLDTSFNPSKQIVLEEKPAMVFNQGENKGDVSIIEYSSNKVVFKTKTSGNMLLFLSDNYFPGWKVNVDGKSEKIYRANYSFRAVPVEKGSHKIVFWYYPDSFDLGLKISLITFFGLVLFISIVKIRKSYV